MIAWHLDEEIAWDIAVESNADNAEVNEMVCVRCDGAADGESADADVDADVVETVVK